MSEHSENHWHSSSPSNSQGYDTEHSSSTPLSPTSDSPGYLQRFYGQTPSPPPQTPPTLPTSSNHHASLALPLKLSAVLMEHSTKDVSRELREVPGTPTVKRKRGLDDEQAMYVNIIVPFFQPTANHVVGHQEARGKGDEAIVRVALVPFTGREIVIL